MSYTIPNTTVEVVTLLPNTHISPETAYVVDDYPYGFNLRCKIRYWLEVNLKKGGGTRLMSQTSNPKKAGLVWNKPKPSTYCKFAGAMFLDQNGHVQWKGLHEYMDTKESEEYREVFGAAVPEAGQRIMNAWLKAKHDYDEYRAAHTS